MAGMLPWRDIPRADQKAVLVQLGLCAIEAAKLYPGRQGLAALVDAFIAAIEQLEGGSR
jgi:hypothetical protein